MFNVVVAGRVTKDAETRDTGSQKVTNFTVAVDVGYGDKKHAVFIDCAAWGDRWGKVAEYIIKGGVVAVTGNGDLRMWESNGKHGANVTINVSELSLLGGKSDAKPKREEDVPGLEDSIPF